LNDNPYQTPTADLKTELKQTHRGRPIIAVLVATLINFICTNAAIEIVTKLLTPIKESQLISSLSLAIITICCLITIVTGYLCARISKRSVYICITIYAILIILLANVFSGKSSLSFSETSISYLLTVISAYAGGWIYLKKR
jgi:Na+/melibiose symporter-like transporter